MTERKIQDDNVRQATEERDALLDAVERHRELARAGQRAEANFDRALYETAARIKRGDPGA